MGRSSQTTAIVCASILLAGCGGGAGEETTTPAGTGPAVGVGVEPPGEPPAASIKGESKAELEDAAKRGVAAYIRALNSHDGRRVCAVLAPGALDGVRLPEPRESCTESLDASIGHKEPGGFPEWQRTRLKVTRVVLQGEDSARITATVKHDFARRPEISTEEDLIYVERHGDRWLIAKPSATFYRAIGARDVPPQVLAPPS